MKTGISALAKSGKTMSLLNFFSCSANQNPNSMSCEKEKRTSLEKKSCLCFAVLHREKAPGSRLDLHEVAAGHDVGARVLFLPVWFLSFPARTSWKTQYKCLTISKIYNKTTSHLVTAPSSKKERDRGIIDQPN